MGLIQSPGAENCEHQLVLDFNCDYLLPCKHICIYSSKGSSVVLVKICCICVKWELNLNFPLPTSAQLSEKHEARVKLQVKQQVLIFTKDFFRNYFLPGNQRRLQEITVPGQ